MGRKIVLFLALLTVYVACLGESMLLGRMSMRLAVMYIVGAYCAIFAEGTTLGTMQPISTRPVMIIVGVMMMGASLMWLLALRDALGK